MSRESFRVGSSFDDGRADGQIRDKVPVHDIDVQHGSATSLHALDFVGQSIARGTRSTA